MQSVVGLCIVAFSTNLATLIMCVKFRFPCLLLYHCFLGLSMKSKSNYSLNHIFMNCFKYSAPNSLYWLQNLIFNIGRHTCVWRSKQSPTSRIYIGYVTELYLTQYALAVCQPIVLYSIVFIFVLVIPLHALYVNPVSTCDLTHLQILIYESAIFVSDQC